ncbi:MAG TPA: acetyl-CoA hydrolase/transferase C-terminal domain-containing protein, partial [Gemmatimonadales bacterium]
MTSHPDWRSRAVSADEVLGHLRSGARAFVHGTSATPTPLLEALARRTDLEGVRLYHLHLDGPVPTADPKFDGKVRHVALFLSAQLRGAVAEGRADFVPIFLSDVPGLFASGRVPLDAALLQLSPPDAHGLCTLGTSVEAARAAADSAKVILAEINLQMPRTHGNAFVPFDKVRAFTVTDRPLLEHHIEPEGPVEAAIGKLVAGLVEDGSTLQAGIGGIPNAVLRRLTTKRDLGVHTEMFSDGMLDLWEAGAITNRLKATGTGRIVTSFVTGTRRVFDFVNDNPLVEFLPCDRTNDTLTIHRNPKVVAINSALQIDLTGQVCADSIGDRFYSGIGGQVDFIRGASMSPGGLPIIALRSTARDGSVSRIVSNLDAGAGVVTSRGDVRYVVTEYGIADLLGKSVRERATALMSIAHPDFRADLLAEAKA